MFPSVVRSAGKGMRISIVGDGMTGKSMLLKQMLEPKKKNIVILNCHISIMLNEYINQCGYNYVNMLECDNLAGIIIFGDHDIIHLYNKIQHLEFVPKVIAYVGNDISKIYSLFHEHIGINLLTSKSDNQIKIAIDHLFEMIK